MEQPQARQQHDQPATLGDLLFSRRSMQPVSESEWTALVDAIAEGHPGALHRLYGRMHRIVLTFLVRMTNNQELAEELTSHIFYEVWRRPSVFNPGAGSVVGWLMNLTRARALDRLWFRARRRRATSPVPVPAEPADPDGPDRPIAGRVDLLPGTSPWERIARRIAGETGKEVSSDPTSVSEPDWEDAGPGISYKILARDAERDRVSMLVRLAPGAAYPPHTHAGVEELYLLDGELMIDGETLYPGAYNRAEACTSDELVWSESGCTCVLLTSSKDILR